MYVISHIVFPVYLGVQIGYFWLCLHINHVQKMMQWEKLSVRFNCQGIEMELR